ncbi:MAG: calcium/sodium antiporter [Lachnospiraceae bacterium]|nr:calcium/sodium antiporter [Lachnospiraceae bacterium]
MEILIQLLLLVVGFVLLVKGADWFVDGVSGIAERFGIPQLVIGLTIVAMGTSAPEAAVSITAALKGDAEITIGNILGSNILNVLIILGITAVITSVAVQKSTFKIEIPFVIAITALILGFGMTGGQVTRVEGIVFLVVFAGFLFYLYRMAINGEGDDAEDAEEPKPIWQLLLFTVIGIIMVVAGSDVVVDSATALAEIFGMSERFIGLTIVALGTSLPELVTSTVAAVKGKADIAIGNIVGSNIFNILFVVGITSLIVPVPFASGFLVDALVAILAVVVLWLCLVRNRKLNRVHGIIMLAIYACYFVYLL